MILLDTNVLLRFAKLSDPFFVVTLQAITHLESSGETLCIVAQNIFEFWTVATRPSSTNGLGMTSVECAQEVAQLKMMFTFLPDHANLYNQWESLVIRCQCHGKISHDARLVAAMNLLGIKSILTYNTIDFARFPNITILHPPRVAASSMP